MILLPAMATSIGSISVLHNDADSDTVNLTVKALMNDDDTDSQQLYNRDGIQGYTVSLADGNGTVIISNTPANFTLTRGQNYTLTAYELDFGFDHWSDTGSTNKTRSILIPMNDDNGRKNVDIAAVYSFKKFLNNSYYGCDSCVGAFNNEKYANKTLFTVNFVDYKGDKILDRFYNATILPVNDGNSSRNTTVKQISNNTFLLSNDTTYKVTIPEKSARYFFKYWQEVPATYNHTEIILQPSMRFSSFTNATLTAVYGEYCLGEYCSPQNNAIRYYSQ